MKNNSISFFIYQLRHAFRGHYGFTTDDGLFYHLTHSFYYGYGLLPLSFSLLGLCWIVRTNRINIQQKLVITIFPLMFYLLMASSRLAFQRYMLPLIPFLGVYSSLGLFYMYSATNINSIRKSRAFIIGLTFLIFALISISIIPNDGTLWS